MAKAPQASGESPSAAAHRIQGAAYELFSRHGVRNVGVDLIAARAGVAKRTLYKHYPSKRRLALEFLRQREESWTHGWLRAAMDRGRTPGDKLLAVFDAFDSWFRRGDFAGCPFVKVVLEHGEPRHPLKRAAAAHLGTIQGIFTDLARAHGADDPGELAAVLLMLLMGAVVAALAGDVRAARRAKRFAVLLIEGARP